MISVSQEFQDQLNAYNHDYLLKVDITLTDNTVLSTITKDHLFQFVIEDGVSPDNKFSALGSAIINQAIITLDNSERTYSFYDFTGAKVNLQIGLVLADTTEEYISGGKYIVDSATPRGSGIELICLDYMSKFDRSYTESQLLYPTTIQQIVNEACSICGVPLASTIPYSTDTITLPPSGITNFREALSYIGQITGTFAHVDRNGELYFKWFDKDSLEDAQEDTSVKIDGVHYIDDVMSVIPEQSDIEITGIRTYLTNYITGVVDKQEYIYGSEDFCLDISGNQYVNGNNVNTILNRVGQSIVGLVYRKLSCTHINNPIIEAGDVAMILYDEENGVKKYYPVVITRTVFTVNGKQTTICGSETVAENRAARDSDVVRVEDVTGVLSIASSAQQTSSALNDQINGDNGLANTVAELNGDMSDAQNQLNQMSTVVNGVQNIANDYEQLRALYLDFDEDPSIGLVIGGKTADAGESLFTTNITNTQMSFKQNGEIIAYINGLKYHIRRGEIEQSLTVGTFEWRIEDILESGDTLNLVML